jgi:hypothetical protein
MDQVVLFLREDGGVCILIPTGALSLAETIAKDVPVGLPYIPVDRSEVPTDRTFREAWEVDFTGAPVNSGRPEDVVL